MADNQYYSLLIEEHTSVGTRRMEALFERSTVAYIEHESISAMILFCLESFQCVKNGSVVECETSFTMPFALELNERERALLKWSTGKKGVHRFKNSFVTPNKRKAN